MGQACQCDCDDGKYELYQEAVSNILTLNVWAFSIEFEKPATFEKREEPNVKVRRKL